MGPRDSTLLPLPYADDSGARVDALRDLPGCIFFDSGVPGLRRGRYDIATAAPLYTLRYRSGILTDSGAHPVALGGDALVGELNHRLRTHHARNPAPASPVPALPFRGGFAGYASYDLARNWTTLPATAVRDIDVPELVLGFYPWSLVTDHETRQSWLSLLPECPEALRERLIAKLKVNPEEYKKFNFNIINKLQETVHPKSYQSSFEKIQGYLRAGDCYQVNFTTRFDGAAEGDPWIAYRALRASISAPFGAWFAFGSRDDREEDSAILCCSPERFVSLVDGQVLTQPIKGTSRRSRDPAEDARLARDLQASEKNRAENLMIVDLLRNDLGTCCDTGSIRTEQLFALESTPYAHHLVSSITGRLQRGKTAFDLLRATLPGGSITGAPKRRAMEIIEELEPARRAVYCGALAYIDVGGNLDSNIAIRTVLYTRGRLHAWAGGGIVADSEAEAEHRELLLKISRILETVNALG